MPATFVYAGINVERAGLLNGTRGEQIAGRFSMIRTGAFGRGQQWHALIAALEDSLRLHHHRPDTLVELADYLHNRSNGMIGSLLRLIRAAAIQAVLDGTETITRADPGIDPRRHRLHRRTPRPRDPRARRPPGDQPRRARLERLQDRPPPRPRPQDAPCLPQRPRAPGQPREHADSFAPFAAYAARRVATTPTCGPPACTAN